MSTIQLKQLRRAIERVLQNSNLDYIEGMWDKMILLYFIQQLSRKYRGLQDDDSVFDFIDDLNRNNERLKQNIENVQKGYQDIIQRVEQKLIDDVDAYRIFIQKTMKEARESLKWI